MDPVRKGIQRTARRVATGKASTVRPLVVARTSNARRFSSLFTGLRSFLSMNEGPGYLNMAARASKGEEKVLEKTTLDRLIEIANAQVANVKRKTGIGVFDFFKLFKFNKELKDPRSVMKLAFQIVSTRGDMSGEWGHYEESLRKSNKRKKNKKQNEDYEDDHIIGIADVALKLLIHAIQVGLPTLDEIKHIYIALNNQLNIRTIPKKVHKVISKIQAQGVNRKEFRMYTMVEQLESLSKEDKDIFYEHFKTNGEKEYFQIQKEKCEEFTNELNGKTKFLTTFAQNFKDYLLKHRTGNTQTGGGNTFTKSEQKLSVVILELIEPAISEKRSEENVEMDTETAVKEIQKSLQKMKSYITNLFKEANTIYKSDHAPLVMNRTRNNRAQSRSGIRLPIYNMVANATRNRNPLAKLQGGMTYKKKR